MLDRRRQAGARQQQATTRRAAPRVRVALPAAADTVSGRKNVKLANLSRTGAMLEGPELPSVGHNVVLKSGDVDVFATVVWRTGERCGITFDRPVREEEVQRLRLAGEWSARTGVLPDVRQAAEDWAGGRGR